jgi:hypothetical protein
MMYHSASQIAWYASGAPCVVSCCESVGICFLCGGSVTRGTSVDEWMGDGFNDHARVASPASGVVCEACCYVTSRVSPVPGRPPGPCSCCDGTLIIVTPSKGRRECKGDPCTKCDGTGLNEHGGNWRQYSHLWEDGVGYSNASKAEKYSIREFLSREHHGAWFCAIAASGQKHVLPFCHINYGRRSGIVAFESDLVRLPNSLELVDSMTEILTSGVTKREIESGEYGARSWSDCEHSIRHFEFDWGRQRGSGWFGCALWLAQKVETEDGTKGARQSATRRDRVVPRSSEQSIHADAGSSRFEALESPPSEPCGEPHGSSHHGSVARDDPKSPAPNSTHQLSLFGNGAIGLPSGRSRR